MTELADSQTQTPASSIAAIVGDEEITYAGFLADIQAAEAWLGAQLSTDEERIIVSLRHTYWHWVVTLALLQLGKACVSILKPATLEPVPGEAFHACLTDFPLTLEGRVLDVPYAGLRSASRQAPDAEPPESALSRLKFKLPGRAQRILLTSGTTGRPKMVCIRAALLHERLQAARSQYGRDVSSQTRLLTLMGIDTIGGFLITLITWLRGGLVLFGVPAEHGSGEVGVPVGRSNLLSASPARLKDLLARERGVFPGHAQRLVRVGGARLHVSVRDEALRRLGCRVQTTYGATELGLVASCDAMRLDQFPGAAGQVFPNVQVEIVDRRDQPVAAGAEGVVRCRTPGMAEAYVGEPQSEQFRDGWFYPGDLGTLSEDGFLVITGRISDVINLGGRKLSAVDLETRLLHAEGLKDVCVAMVDDAGSMVLVVVVVHDDDLQTEAMRPRIEKLLPKSLPFDLVRVPALPRNEMGKLPRALIARLLKQLLREQRAPQ